MLNISEYLIYIDYILLLLLSYASCQQVFSDKFNGYGFLSVLSLSMYFSIHLMSSAFNILVLVAFIAALIFLVLELFIPGGILGVFGVLALLYSLIGVNNSNQNIIFVISLSVLVFVVLALLNIYVFKKKMLFLNKLILKDSLTTEKGYVANFSKEELLDKELVAYTDLRPSGIAIIDNEKYDVVSEGDYIEKGSAIVVSEVIGMRIVVRKK